MTSQRKRWVIAEPEPALVETLALALRFPPALAQVLVNRGFRDVESAQRFLNPQLRQLSDPFELPDMSAAVDRVLAAIDRRERIVIYGDYDVDGLTSSALLTRVLHAVCPERLEAGATVDNFLPYRMDEGYGLSADGIARCLREYKPDLLIAVDCGTSSVNEIAELGRHGMDVIVLDHHEPSSELPDCVALVNPKVVGQDARATALASVGVSFKLAHALQKRGRERGLAWANNLDLREHLDLVAVGTVADMVPLTGENRILTRAGLERLATSNKVGLRALMDIADVPDEVTPYHIGFRIGPRLNAAGRIGDAMAALELLLTEDRARAAALAKFLNDHNSERQRLEEQMIGEALAMARAEVDLKRERVLVLAKEGWHVGVIGIVASRVLQEFYRPTVIIGIGAGMGKGSCRSIAGFSMVVALRECAPLLERFGGHEMAAGLSVKAEKIPALRKALNEIAARTLCDEDSTPRVMIDAEMLMAELDGEFFDQLTKFEPCGIDNPAPLFMVCGVRLRGTPRVVGNPPRGGLKFLVTDGETTTEAIWWGAGARELPAGEFDVAFAPELNKYGGAETVQLRVKDVRAAVEERGV
jgi:single-stranded-DNA-specific exonuclease